MRVGTLIAAIVIILVIAYLVWQIINSTMAGNARQNRNKRRSDRVRLGRAERKAYKRAQQLYQSGNFKACAKILESLGLLRESISVLENAGFYREAADALIRIQRPNRAGHLLARNGLWKEALEAYKKANMPLEIGKCYRELGDVSTAIPFFLEAGARQEAADCFVEVGKHQEAAKLYLKLEKLDKAIEQYVYLVDSSIDLEKLRFSEAELTFIISCLVEGKADTRLADILASEKKSGILMVELIKTGNLRAATEAYMRNTADIGPELIGFGDFNRDQQQLLASLFINVSAYEYGGIVYERIHEFEKAGEAFEKGEYFERACQCYERINNREKATSMRIAIASQGSGSPKPATLMESKHGNTANPFSIQDTESNGLPAPSPPSVKAAPFLVEAGIFLQKDDDTTSEPELIAGEKDPSSGLDWIPFYQAEFMAELSTDEKETLQHICETEHFEPGEIILEFKQEPLGVYFVLSGRISILKLDEKNREVGIDLLEKGDTFGEYWLLMDQPSQFKFVAKDASTLCWIRRADFENLVDRNGSVARKLYKAFSQSLVNRLLNKQQKKENMLVS